MPCISRPKLLRLVPNGTQWPALIADPIAAYYVAADCDMQTDMLQNHWVIQQSKYLHLRTRQGS